MRPNKFQKAAAEVYAGGDYAWLAKSKNWRKDLASCGDGLLAYVMIDLSTDEACDSWNDAALRIICAIDDLSVVRDALIEQLKKEGK
jgi:hypothetical protein